MHGNIGFGGYEVWFVAIALLVALGAGILALVRHPRSDGDRALDIITERFAKGEIDEDEFRSIKSTLEA